jgi:RNA polymerase sigma-70 factor (ECF subfamily)
VCHVPIGTVKSRVNRARLKLADLLSLTKEAELGPDDVTKAALAAD